MPAVKFLHERTIAAFPDRGRVHVAAAFTHVFYHRDGVMAADAARRACD